MRRPRQLSGGNERTSISWAHSKSSSDEAGLGTGRFSGDLWDINRSEQPDGPVTAVRHSALRALEYHNNIALLSACRAHTARTTFVGSGTRNMALDDASPWPVPSSAGF